MIQGAARSGVVALALLSALACTSSNNASPSGPTGPGETKNQTIGASGGTVTTSGATLTVPRGALASDTAISVSSSSDAPPSGATAYSPVFVFGPDGTQFGAPVSVSLAFNGDAAKAVVFWSKSDGTFEKLSSNIANGMAMAQVTHFSRGFVGDGTVTFPLLGGGTPSNDAGGGSSPCPIGTWSMTMSGPAACDGGSGKLTLTVAQGSGGVLAVTQETVNVKGGLGCGYRVSGTATYEANALNLDLAVDDNGCAKHWLSTWTVDASCKTMSTPDGALTIKNCQACATTGQCSGCGTASCTTRYGGGTLTKE
jgi:hypothetical protein